MNKYWIFLLFTVVALLVVSCKKDNFENISEESKETTNVQIKDFDWSPTEAKFFDLYRNNETQERADETDKTNFITEVLNTIATQNEEYQFVDDIIDNHGYPYWLSSFYYQDEDITANKTIFIPLAKEDVDEVTSFIVVYFDGDNLMIQLSDSQAVDDVIMEDAPFFTNFPTLLAMFINFDYELFGKEDTNRMAYWAENFQKWLDEEEIIERNSTTWRVCYQVWVLSQPSITNGGDSNFEELHFEELQTIDKKEVSSNIPNSSSNKVTERWRTGTGYWKIICDTYHTPCAYNPGGGWWGGGSVGVGGVNPIDPNHGLDDAMLTFLVNRHGVSGDKIQDLFDEHGMGALGMLNKMKTFREERGDTDEVREYTDAALDLILEDPEIIWDRLGELHDLLEEDPEALVGECFDNPTDIEAWNDILAFDVPQNCIDRLTNEDLGNQPIEFGNTTTVNLDYYSITFNNLPNQPNSSTPFSSIEDFFDYFQENFNSFLNQSIGDFNYYIDNGSSDEDLWLSSDPLTTIFNAN